MTTALEAMFAGRVNESGKALRRTLFRHTHLANPPLGIALWRLGGERFRAAAIAWGPVGHPFQLAVAGEPRNRDLYFAALARFAVDLCARVQHAAEPKVARQRGSHAQLIPADALQIVVPNRTTVAALGLLGRYLAYLSDRGGVEPHPALVEAGKHLRFYYRQARVTGQSLIVPLDTLLNEHWATLLSPFEQANLAALETQIEPPTGVHAFEASVAAETTARIGPEPTEDVDQVTAVLLEQFNSARAGRTDPVTVKPLLGPLRDHYQRLTEPVWQLMGRIVGRERSLPAAPSVQSRFEADREEFGRHVEWVLAGGRYRTTDTPRQALITLGRLERAKAHYEAEKALDDPACMIPHLLSGDAVRGVVASVNEAHRVMGRIYQVRRALMAVDTDDPVVLPTDKQFWWTDTADDGPWEVQKVLPHGSGSRVVLRLTVATRPDRLPDVGERITLSTLHTGADTYSPQPPQSPPWTHRPATQPLPPSPIDAGDDEAPTQAVDGTTVPDPLVYA